MTSFRPLRLILALVCLFGSHHVTLIPFAQAQPACPDLHLRSLLPAQQPANPFETVPNAELVKPQTTPQAPAAPQFEAPKPVAPGEPPVLPRGQRRRSHSVPRRLPRPAGHPARHDLQQNRRRSITKTPCAATSSCSGTATASTISSLKPNAASAGAFRCDICSN